MFEGSIAALRSACPGVTAAVDSFSEALKFGDGLPGRLVGKDGNGNHQYVHRIDDVSLGTAGKRRFAITYQKTSTPAGTTYILLDIWLK